MSARITLARTALRLGLTYHQVRAMVLRGELAGGQDDRNRFYAEERAVAQYEAARARSKRTPARATRQSGGGR